MSGQADRPVAPLPDAAPAAAEAVTPDPWSDLRAFTDARIALGRAGHALPTAEWLRFSLAHARARDAVHVPLDLAALDSELRALGCATLEVQSAAPDRATYLMRPDLGRRLAPASVARLRPLGAAAAPAGQAAAGDRADDRADGADRTAQAGGCDLLLVVADGLSALAAQRNGPPLVREILRQAPAGWTLGPVLLATQARVALGDEAGELLGARFVAMLVGERPGLGSPDSLGVYLTADPRVGRRDAERNCISNVRAAGLSPAAAARKLWWLLAEAQRLGGATGVALKDRADAPTLDASSVDVPTLDAPPLDAPTPGPPPTGLAG